MNIERVPDRIADEGAFMLELHQWHRNDRPECATNGSMLSFCGQGYECDACGWLCEVPEYLSA